MEIILLLLAILGTPVQAQKSADAKLIATGEITRVDVKKKTFTIESKVERPPLTLPATAGAHADVHDIVAVVLGRPAPQGRGAQIEKPPLIPPDDPPVDDTPRETTVQTIILTFDDTVFLDGDKPGEFGSLKAGDFVSVTGKPKGDNVIATEVKRKPSKP